MTKSVIYCVLWLKPDKPDLSNVLTNLEYYNDLSQCLLIKKVHN